MMSWRKWIFVYALGMAIKGLTFRMVGLDIKQYNLAVL